MTGAHLRAEAGDRPTAYRLRERMLAWLEDHPKGERCAVLVCSDIWYLNNEDLRRLPAVSVGGPGVNALAAYLGDKLPSAFSIEGVLSVQADLDFHEMIASCWGMDARTTGAAVDAFIERYLGHFMEHAVRRLEA